MTWRRLLATLRDRPTPMPAEPPDAATVEVIAAQIDAGSQRRLGRSLALFHVGAGGCNGCEREIGMLDSIAYDLERFGLSFVASPRHADVLLVTGPVTRSMQAALRAAWIATPEPKFVVAAGDCAIDGGVFKGSYAVAGGVETAIPVDLVIRGCPPSPADLLEGLRILIEANAP